MICNKCPRQCGVDRAVTVGYCGEGDTIRLGKAMLHHFEEPCISGERGSGAIFFSGCALRCRYCQNYKLVGSGKRAGTGKAVTRERLGEIMLELQAAGAHNINLVNPTHFASDIAEVLKAVKPQLTIPVVYNCGGYESLETVASLKGLVDIWLPDLKYINPDLAERYSNAPDYFERASQAIPAMVEQVGLPRFDDDGMMIGGVIIRHLVLPKAHQDAIAIIEWIDTNLKDKVLCSVMSQYTPYRKDDTYPQLNRRVYTYEYHKVVECADALSLHGFMQERTSAKEEYTPDFDLSGV